MGERCYKGEPFQDRSSKVVKRDQKGFQEARAAERTRIAKLFECVSHLRLLLICNRHISYMGAAFPLG